MTVIANPPIRQRGPRSLFTPVRITTAIFIGLVCLSLIPAGGHLAWLVGYLLLVLVTCIVLRTTRREPGTWLGRRAVRRAVVGLIAADCVALMATPAPSAGSPTAGSGLLAFLLLLVVLNVALGGATQRVASAPDSIVDERQEALRNHAHRIAYLIFAVVVGGAVVVADVASTETRSWLASGFGGGGWIVLLELLFVLPGMVLAFLEPTHPAPEFRTLHPGQRHDRPALLAKALLALTVAIPVALSLAVVLVPVTTSSTIQAPTDSVVPGATSCREFFATAHLGTGIDASVPLHAEACWNGKRAFETYGMNAGDCMTFSSDMTIVTTTQCTQVTRADGTLAFTYRSDVAPGVMPFLHRQVTLQLIIDRNGNVEKFP
jgi:hypothetical protein